MVWWIIALVFCISGIAYALAGFLRQARGKENEDEEDIVRGRQFMFAGVGLLLLALIVFIIAVVVKTRASSGVSPQGSGEATGSVAPSRSSGGSSVLLSTKNPLTPQTVILGSAETQGIQHQSFGAGYTWSFTTGDGGSSAAEASDPSLLPKSEEPFNPLPGCSNPWPAGRAFPFTDNATHFSLFYCRDQGAPGTGDDLPGLRVVPVPVPSDPRAIKEYLFPLEGVSSNEAFGIKVMSNLLDRGAGVWYEENIKQDRQGAPTALLVDGFQGVRDGATTYVHAPNVAPTNFFTNIYLLSYTSNEPSPAILQIGQQLIANWRFVVNVGAQEKALLVRDTKRLGDLSDTTKLLDQWYAQEGHYPTLSAGSFIASNSLSVWPSWQQTLGKDLGITLPVDPINTLGACPAFDAITCWNEATRNFAGRLPDRLPPGSHVYIYRSTDRRGSRYTLCTIMESTLTRPRNKAFICPQTK